MGSRADLFARIRRDARVDRLGIRALARKHGAGRDAEPPRVEWRRSLSTGATCASIDVGCSCEVEGAIAFELEISRFR
jgi:hypothetical protein